MIFKIFSPKNSAKKLTFLTQNKAKICKILIITLVFEKNANFFAENCRKSQKIVIITLTPGRLRMIKTKHLHLTCGCNTSHGRQGFWGFCTAPEVRPQENGHPRDCEDGVCILVQQALLKPADRGSGNADSITDLHVADGSEGCEFESRGHRFFLWQKVNQSKDETVNQFSRIRTHLYNQGQI
jgi:hypothetical protein